ncbi:MAG: GIY-YIG nuclease family protein [Candidatus Omnitrophica bacterium]|nr:GIY-YIG nuclease family protein [Candidatus Omnitrophota bacterium]MDD5429789.1 GIY-YIG nuclease family protein [Candidatus Omnitrophota bacterium]
MKYVVYAIKSIARNYTYIGLTNDITRRLAQHNSGKERTTKPYAPFNLLYAEICAERKQARTREKYLKSGCGKEFLKKLIVNCAGGGIGRRARLRT